MTHVQPLVLIFDHRQMVELSAVKIEGVEVYQPWDGELWVISEAARRSHFEVLIIM